MRRTSPILGASLVLAACAEPVGPSLKERPATTQLSAPQLFANYVALGTSNSMGVQSAGVFAAAQRAAWPAQLAARVGTPFSLPLMKDPGCGPPLLPPLAKDLVLVAGFAALGEDLVSAVANLCAPLQDGITLPANNLAISGARARDALRTTPEMELARNAKKGELYRRVLPSGHTQVTAMLSQNPTFVSVELAANEVLPANTGLLSKMTPYVEWQADYDQIIAAVQSTGARAVLVGLPTRAAQFPSVRRAREFFNEWPDLLALGITVSFSCYFSSNYVFVPGYVLTLISKSPTTATCANSSGQVDYVLTPSDMTVIDARMAQMNAHIQSKALENGYAYFSLDALYGLPKINFNLIDVLFSSHPFGSNISLDGVHPSASGQAILAAAAAQAISTKYGVAIP